MKPVFKDDGWYFVKALELILIKIPCLLFFVLVGYCAIMEFLK